MSSEHEPEPRIGPALPTPAAPPPSSRMLWEERHAVLGEDIVKLCISEGGPAVAEAVRRARLRAA